MAKPIRATPRLNDKETKQFIERMIRTQNSKITKKDRELADELVATFSI